ncbi:MAG: CapA family protein [Paenibacillaceae bacterium]|jgi:poly-gamma-glutamate synthesis protein (capsule biosynthesis protein)|nr:CapA family protein [Paenibacillaceae bacterium]
MVETRLEKERQKRQQQQVQSMKAMKRVGGVALIVLVLGVGGWLGWWMWTAGGSVPERADLASEEDGAAAHPGDSSNALSPPVPSGDSAATASSPKAAPRGASATAGSGGAAAGVTGAASGTAGSSASAVVVSPGATGTATTGASAPQAASPANESKVRLSFVGDVLLASTVETVMKRNGFDYPYREVLPLLQQPDMTIANFESPVTTRGTPQQKDYVYRTSPNALPPFKEAGFDLVTLANNHTLDYGEPGLLDTMSNLDKAGILRVGAGHNADEAFKPVIVNKNGIKIAFLGFSRVVPDNSWKAGSKTPGLADTYAEKRPLDEIRKAKAQADLVVVMVHWGIERNDKPEAYQTTLGHHYIDAGADLVIGSHPHVLQGLESYKGKWIAYSLGNFIFTTNNVSQTLETVVLDAACSKQGQCDLRVHPIFTEYAKPIPMDEEKGKKLLERLTSISFHSTVQMDGSVKPANR